MFDWLRILTSKARALLSKRHLDEDFAEELQTHLASLTEENISGGMTLEEASRAASLRLGGLTQLQEAHREHRGLPMVETFFQDIRYTVRTLRNNPGFTLVAVLTLALGIGANTAIFSMAQGFLLKPVSLPHLDRLVAIGELQAHDMNDAIRVSPANYRLGVANPVFRSHFCILLGECESQRSGCAPRGSGDSCLDRFF